MQKYGRVIRITVPMLPPSINHAYISRVYKPKHGGKQRVGKFMSKTGKEYKKMMATILDSHQDKGLFPVDYNVKIRFTFCFGTKHRVDLDNRMKVAQDSISGIVIKDDKFPCVKELSVKGRYEKGNPYTIIEVIELIENEVQSQLVTNTGD